MRCVVTGGAGFIGSHLVDEALVRGWNVAVVDNLSSGKRENIAHHDSGLEFIEGDIRDFDLLRRVFRGAEIVFHQAAVASVTVTMNDPRLSAQVNDLGTLNVIAAAREAGVPRVVYASSAAVYGDTPDLPHHERMAPRPKSPYAAHKLIGEHYGSIYGAGPDLQVVSLRYFNVFGPRQDPSSPYSGVISIFMERLVRGEPLVVFGDGRQSRDFIYVEDVVRANFLAADAPAVGGQSLNIGTGRSVTVNRLVDCLSSVALTDARVEYAAPRDGDIKASRAAVAKAGAAIGFEAQTSLEEGLAQTWSWFRSQRRAHVPPR